MTFAPEPEMIQHHEEAHHHDCLLFPTGFLWGAATSAHQVEGGNDKNDWWQWEQRPGSIKDGSRSGEACDHFHRYAQDFKIAKDLGHTVHRLSIEWSRIEPRPGEWDVQAIAHYREVLTELRRLGILSMVTLAHFTLPVWFADRDRWLRRGAVHDFERFVAKVVEELGPLVYFWITINEPMVYATQSYTYGNWPPQRRSTWQTLRVIRALSRAHVAAYRAIHRAIPDAKVGYANNALSMEAYNQRSIVDFAYVAVTSWFWNHGFYALTGKHRHDFIGVNYYFHQRIVRHGFMFWRLIDARQEAREHSEIGWEVNPQGFFRVLLDLSGYKLPIYVTENGIAADNDRKRIRYIVSHIRELHNAMVQGANIRGYLHWSLLDNFEWEKGFAPRFGLVHVNYQNQERTVKPSAKVMRDIIKKNSLCHEMLVFLGHSVEYREGIETEEGKQPVKPAG